MATATLSIRVSHDLSEFATRLSAYPERVERAMSEGTREAVRHTERFFEEEMIRRAGGKYWDIDSQVTPSYASGGARGSVSTHKNKAHRIEPTKPHGILANRETGFFSRGGVNHPGSRPIDVLSPLRRTERPRLRGIYRENVREALGGPSSAMPVGSL